MWNWLKMPCWRPGVAEFIHRRARSMAIWMARSIASWPIWCPGARRLSLEPLRRTDRRGANGDAFSSGGAGAGDQRIDHRGGRIAAAGGLAVQDQQFRRAIIDCRSDWIQAWADAADAALAVGRSVGRGQSGEYCLSAQSRMLARASGPDRQRIRSAHR